MSVCMDIFLKNNSMILFINYHGFTTKSFSVILCICCNVNVVNEVNEINKHHYMAL